MMGKKIIFAIGLFFMVFSSHAAASLIDNYTVTNPAALGEDLSISGKYIDDLNNNSGVMCDFYITDANTGEKIYRLTNSSPNPQGIFYGKMRVTEPKLKRGEDYNALAICGNAQATANFTVGQRGTLFQPLLSEFQYVTDMGNIAPFFFVILFLFVVFGIPYLVYQWFKSKGGGT